MRIGTLAVATVLFFTCHRIPDAAAQVDSAPGPSPVALVRLHVGAPSPVDLEVQEGDHWRVVCTAPCNALVSQNDLYRIGGSFVRQSKAFRLNDVERSGEVTIEVEPTSATDYAIAVTLVAVGIAGVLPIAGVTTALVGAALLFGIGICFIVAASSHEWSYFKCIAEDTKPIHKLYGSPWVWAPALGGVLSITAGGILRPPASTVFQTAPSTGPVTALDVTPAQRAAALSSAALPAPMTFTLLERSF